ncbi:AEC family transporter [Limnohabitans sp. Hippo4]|uniref:AEC family transporter n=1 Tax=Limnohabitans sp. Hippo4 TaxID=1826167 RepID=UPI000D34BEDD|nr:AEC family transporter [Limnohabitans sp. Hippo4]PUE37500.1 permease [Limnohabitans sp. Hippo4]
MFDILAITAPIYIAIALGYGLTRWGFFQKTDMRAFGTFVVKVAMPALLFNALSQRKVSDILNAEYVTAYALASLFTLSLSIAWALRVSKVSRSLSSCLAMGMSCPNSGFVGYPVMLLSLGPLASVAGVALALNMMVENLIIIPLLLAWAETGQSKSRWQGIIWQTLKGMFYNPMIWGIVLGFLFSWFEWQLPSSLGRTVSLFAQASGALSLFVIGGSLVSLPVQGMGPRVAQIAAGKLVLHPLMMLVVMTFLLPIQDPVLRVAALLTCAMPMFGIYPILTQKHGHDGLSAAALLVTTMASFFTLNALLWQLKNLNLL